MAEAAFESSVTNGIPVISASGEIDISNVASLRELVEKALSTNPRAIIISFDQVRYLDSTTFNHIVQWASATRLLIVKPKLRAVASLFYLLKFEEIIRLTDSLEEASEQAFL